LLETNHSRTFYWIGKKVIQLLLIVPDFYGSEQSWGTATVLMNHHKKNHVSRQIWVCRSKISNSLGLEAVERKSNCAHTQYLTQESWILQPLSQWSLAVPAKITIGNFLCWGISMCVCGCNHTQLLDNVPKAISASTISPQPKAQRYHSLAPAKANPDFHHA